MTNPDGSFPQGGTPDSAPMQPNAGQLEPSGTIPDAPNATDPTAPAPAGAVTANATENATPGTVPAPPPAPTAPTTFAAPATAPAGTAAPDPGKVQDLAGQIVPTLRDGLADTMGVAAATLQTGAEYFAPMIARQALMEITDDPAAKARAVANRRHLNGQILMSAAANGIPLEQRHEQRALGIVSACLSIALRAATGGIA